MKKNYIAPQSAVADMWVLALLTSSTSIWSEGTDIGYGGVDTNGGMEPAARYDNSVWDDEESDEW